MKWLTASSYMGKYLRISPYIRKPYLIYDFATAPIWISLFMRKIWFSFWWCASFNLMGEKYRGSFTKLQTYEWTLKLLVNYADVTYYNYLSCMIMYYHTEWKINYIILFIVIHFLFICRRWRGAGQCSRVSCSSIPTATATPVTAVESAGPISG